MSETTYVAGKRKFKPNLRPMLLSYRNLRIDAICKSGDWFVNQVTRSIFRFSTNPLPSLLTPLSSRGAYSSNNMWYLFIKRKYHKLCFVNYQLSTKNPEVTGSSLSNEVETKLIGRKFLCISLESGFF